MSGEKHPFALVSGNPYWKQFSIPPGSAIEKVDVLQKSMIRLIGTPLIVVCPDAKDFLVISREYNRLMANPARFQGPTAPALDACIGRLGAFIIHVFPHAPFAKSVHLQEASVTSASDYDPDWVELCQELKRSSYVFTDRAVELVRRMRGAPATEETLQQLAEAFGNLAVGHALRVRKDLTKRGIVTTTKMHDPTGRPYQWGSP